MLYGLACTRLNRSDAQSAVLRFPQPAARSYCAAARSDCGTVRSHAQSLCIDTKDPSIATPAMYIKRPSVAIEYHHIFYPYIFTTVCLKPQQR